MSTLTLILGASDPEMIAIEELGHQVGAEIRYALSARGVRVRADEAYQTVAIAARLHMDRRSMDAPLPPDGTVYAVECDGPAIPPNAIRIDHHRPGDPGYGRPPAEFLPASSIGQIVGQLAKSERIRDWDYAELAWSYGEDDVELIGPRGRKRTLDHFDNDDLIDVGAPIALGSQQPDMCVYDEGTAAWWVHWGYGGCDVGSCDVASRIPGKIVLIAAADHCLAAAYRGECPGVDPDELIRYRRAHHDRV